MLIGIRPVDQLRSWVIRGVDLLGLIQLFDNVGCEGDVHFTFSSN